MGLSAKDLRALADQIDATPADAFMHWADGVPQYAPVLDRWMQAVKGLGAPRPSKVYDDILAGAHDRPTPDTITSADKKTLIGYATFVIRGERFSYGLLAERQKDGTLGAILRRFADLKARKWFF